MGEGRGLCSNSRYNLLCLSFHCNCISGSVLILSIQAIINQFYTNMWNIYYASLVVARVMSVQEEKSNHSGCGRPGFDPLLRHTNAVKTCRVALLSLALGTNELGN